MKNDKDVFKKLTKQLKSNINNYIKICNNFDRVSKKLLGFEDCGLPVNSQSYEDILELEKAGFFMSRKIDDPIYYARFLGAINWFKLYGKPSIKKLFNHPSKIFYKYFNKNIFNSYELSDYSNHVFPHCTTPMLDYALDHCIAYKILENTNYMDIASKDSIVFESHYYLYTHNTLGMSKEIENFINLAVDCGINIDNFSYFYPNRTIRLQLIKHI